MEQAKEVKNGLFLTQYGEPMLFFQKNKDSPPSILLTLRPVCHQVHLAVRALPELPDMLILLDYICCWQRGDGQGLHVLHRHRSAVARLGCRRASAAAHPSWPRWRKRQARLDAVGQTTWRRGGGERLRGDCTGLCSWDISLSTLPYTSICTLRTERVVKSERV